MRYLLLAEERKEEVYSGYTENYLPVRLPAPKGLSGKLVPIVVAGVKDDLLTADLDCLQEPFAR